MSGRRNPEKMAFSHRNLNNLLRRARAVIADRIKDKPGPVASSLRDVDTKLQELETRFRRFEDWEDRLMDELTVAARRINQILSDVMIGVGDVSGSGFLKDLDEEIEELNKRLRAPSLVETGLETRDQVFDREKDAPALTLEKWFELEMEENIFKSPEMADLQASYDNLKSLDLRLCFLYFSIFPEDAVVKKTPLIYWWIGEGLIKSTTEKTAEEVGEAIFQQLIELRLINPHNNNNTVKPCPAVNACKIHPWIRHMLISLAKNAGLFMFDPRGTPLNDQKSRHRLLVSGTQNDPPTPRKEDVLFSVFNLSENYLSFESDWLRKSRMIEVLQLGRWHNSPLHDIIVANEEHFLEGLGTLKQLKYLSLRGVNGVTQLPSSIVDKLHLLEILDLKTCHNLERVTDLGSLRKLTHVDLSDCHFLETMPRGIEKLSALQVLKGFVIGKATRTSSTITDLVGLKKLRRLSIFVRNEADAEKGTFNFKDLHSVRCLTITWGVKYPLPLQLAALISMSFPPDLVKLDLRGIPLLKQQDSPDQKTPLLEELKPSKLTNLKRLYITGGELRRLEPEENEKWSVEILRLKYLKHFKIDRQKLLTGFPKLIYLEVKCDEEELERRDKTDREVR